MQETSSRNVLVHLFNSEYLLSELQWANHVLMSHLPNYLSALHRKCVCMMVQKQVPSALSWRGCWGLKMLSKIKDVSIWLMDDGVTTVTTARDVGQTVNGFLALLHTTFCFVQLFLQSWAGFNCKCCCKYSCFLSLRLLNRLFVYLCWSMDS